MKKAPVPNSKPPEPSARPPAGLSNRRARYQYHILGTWEAGIALRGPEVKSLRAGKANLQDSFARIENNEIFLYQMHVTPYGYTHHEELSPTRPRKLLLHREEIRKLAGRTQEKGLTLIPLEIFFNAQGMAKVTLALAKGKVGPDRREDIKRRDQEREVRRDFRARTKF